MNEKSKERMGKQHKDIIDSLSNTFNLPVFVDELSEDEQPESLNYFYVIYGDYQKSQTVNRLLQEIYIVYVSQNNPEIEFDTLDVITTISKVNGIEFNRTIKERLQLDDTDSYLDQINFIFKRKVAYEC